VTPTELHDADCVKKKEYFEKDSLLEGREPRRRVRKPLNPEVQKESGGRAGEKEKVFLYGRKRKKN